MEITAAMVKKLRDETDAPMMECKAALVEANGDYDRAKEILREKGKAAAAKRADRSTSAGVAKFAVSEDGKKAAGIVIESETDFVSGNPEFQALADKLANGMLAAGQSGMEAVIDGESVASLIEKGIALFRENIVLKNSAVLDAKEGVFAIYNHHTGKSASAVEVAGDAKNLKDIGFQVAIQAVAASPQFLNKDEVPADVIQKEIATETQRAKNEGHDDKKAEMIATGRVNKEYFQKEVLMEQPFYADSKKSVTTYVGDEAKSGGGSAKVVQYSLMIVGA